MSEGYSIDPSRMRVRLGPRKTLSRKRRRHEQRQFWRNMAWRARQNPIIKSEVIRDGTLGFDVMVNTHANGDHYCGLIYGRAEGTALARLT